MLIKNKRGISETVVLYMILTALTIVVIAIAVDHFYTELKDKLEVQDCRNSIIAHSTIASITKRDLFSDVKCPTRNIKIDLKAKEDPKRVIAEDMRRCYYEWLKGDGQFFKGDGIICHVCSVYEFKQKNEHMQGLLGFIANENIVIDRNTYPLDTRKMRYIEYFQPFYSLSGRDESGDRQIPPEYDTLDTSKRYASIFVYISDKQWIDKFLEEKRGVAASTGFAFGLGGIAAVGVGAIKTGSTFLAIPGYGWVIGGTIIAAGGGIVLVTALSPNDPIYFSGIEFREYTTNTIAGLKCQRIETNQLSHSKP